MDSSTIQGKEWEQSGECRESLPPSLMSDSCHMECREKEERGHSFIYYDASCSVGLMCGEQTVFYVLILQAVCVGWG